MAYRIKHISYLSNGERKIIKSNSTGLFTLRSTGGKGSAKWKIKSGRPMKAADLVKHPSVKNGDPVLTLTNGDKMRVYLSGDPSHMVIEAQSIIEDHDNTKKKEEKKPKLDLKPNSNATNSESYEEQTLRDLFADFPEW
jgi:hypothetical protein|tara:strand:- start:369 stop:785 length:417 start_codon:yes stop_codon:yes gene_type:complete